jgi:hypothetical protein
LTLSSLVMNSNLLILSAIASLTQWYAITPYFFFNTLEGNVIFKLTETLYFNIFSERKNATPSDQNMHLFFMPPILSHKLILPLTSDT